MPELKKRIYDVYAQDPATRLKALEETEGIKDVTLPTAFNLGVMNTGGAAGLNMIRGLASYNAVHDFREKENPGIKDYLMLARRAALPFIPDVHGRLVKTLLDKFPSLAEATNLPYLSIFK